MLAQKVYCAQRIPDASQRFLHHQSKRLATPVSHQQVQKFLNYMTTILPDIELLPLSETSSSDEDSIFHKCVDCGKSFTLVCNSYKKLEGQTLNDNNCMSNHNPPGLQDSFFFL
jgi:hypothetical protein